MTINHISSKILYIFIVSFINNNMKQQQKVVIGLSGGVDSSVAAFLLKKQRYKVIAIFMKSFSDTKDPITGECSYLEERKMAQKIASILEIPFITLDYENQYKKEVVNYLFKSYKQGFTPNPDILCNKSIKFPALWKIAKRLKADYIATGHYAKIENTKEGFCLCRPKDELKDQTYFLSDLSQDDLSHTLFPLYNLTKSQVRDLAKKHKFPNWNKQGTRGVCFIGKLDFKSFLKNKIKEKQGKVLSPEGKVIGTHPGIYYFTIGERIGESKKIIINKEYKKTNPSKRLYIAKKLINKNILIIAPESHPILKTKTIKINKLHLINPNEKVPNILKVKIRHMGSLTPGKLKKTNSKYIFTFSRSQEGVAPGQFLAFYHKNKVLGCGEIRI